MKTILVLIDFSDVTNQVLEHALGMSRSSDGDVVLLHVVPEEALLAVDFAPPPIDSDPEVFNARQRQLVSLGNSLKTHGVRLRTQQVQGELLTTLLAQIQEIQPDIIIMGSHGHGALYNLLVGSVTATVLKHASQPVLVVPSVRVDDRPPMVEVQEHEPVSSQFQGSMAGLPFPP